MADIDLDTPLEKAFPECSVRLRGVFRRMGKKVLRDVVGTPLDEFRMVRNMGQTTIRELYQLLSALGWKPSQVLADPKCVTGGLARNKTLRDDFAGRVLAGMLASENGCSLPAWPDDSTLESRAVPGAYKRLAVQEAYAWADAMIAERAAS